MPLEKLMPSKGYDGLTPDCGPHCGTANGRTGHCPECHRLESLFNDARDAHRAGRDFVARVEV
jgi:hypothetical protein